MSFAGVSVVADGRLLQPSSTASAIYSSTTCCGSWYHHLLVVEGYSRIKDTLNGVVIRSRPFKAGGYQWALKFYPNGNLLDDAGYISVFLTLDQDVAQPVKAHHQFTFIGEVGKQEPARVRAAKTSSFHKKGYGFGLHHFVKRGTLEKSKHLKDDCFTIRCDFIIAEAADAVTEVPPSNISEHLNHLFVTKLGADVTFEIGHETFAAHRCVLASRSAVFMAELFGPMKEGIATADAIQIQDMEPDVFKALLSFVYTDSMPKMEVQGEAGEAVARVTWLRHLLAAADRFDLQRLKSMCEHGLWRHIDLSSVTAILGLSAQHHCHGLKEACLEFLKVQSAEDLQVVMATSEWEHIAVTDLSIVKELIAKLASKA
ncbi:hypothetical protein ACQJBY_041273 [Aegilops geniculata]